MNIEFATPLRRPLAVEMTPDAGSFYDGRRFSISLGDNYGDTKLNS